MKIYMAVTPDELELPVAVADTVPQLAHMMGVSGGTIARALCLQRKGKRMRSIYHEVEVGDDERLPTVK